MRIAVFPGTFNPITRGHEEVVLRALPMFDQIIVLVANNPTKKTEFDVFERMQMIENVFESEPNVKAHVWEGLTTDFCKQHDVKYMLRGIRSSIDFEYEKNIDFANKIFAPDIETIYLISSHQNSMVSSSMVREIHKYGGDIKPYIPRQIHKYYK